MRFLIIAFSLVFITPEANAVTIVAPPCEGDCVEEMPQNILTVIYTQGIINNGPLSFGLSELPDEVVATFLLSTPPPPTPPPPPAPFVPIPFPNTFNLTDGDVISATVKFGDATWTTGDLNTFSMEFDDGEVSLLTYQFSPILSPTTTGNIILNFPLSITGTDIASGEAFQYTYAASAQTLTSSAVPEPATVALGLMGIAGLMVRRRRAA